MRGRSTPPRAVCVTARAKLNLGLAVGPRRPDGFHDLATIFQSISLADTLIARRRRSGFTLRLRAGSRAAARKVPAGADNLVLRAARLFAARHAFTGGVAFELVKRIPAQAGLGGGSADAAAALLAMEKLSGRRASRARRLVLAAELGSDVPFAVVGGTCLGTGRGERLRRLRLARSFRALVIVPSWRISTADAFRQIDRKRLALTDWGANLRFARNLSRAPVVPERALRLGNRFEDVLGEKQEEFLSLRERLQAAGAIDIGLSGSGSAVFGTIPPGLPSETVARRFVGTEPRFAVRSERSSMRLKML